MLKNRINQMLNAVDANRSNSQYNDELLQIHEGGLLKFVEASMKLELSPRAFERSKGRIPPINILSKTVDKLSKVYQESASRTSPNDINQELINFYEESTEINSAMQKADVLLNLNKSCALEPYIDNGIPKMRVLPSSSFTVMNTSATDPLEVSIFIKIMGEVTDTEGDTYQLYYAYSKDEFVAFTSKEVIVAEQPNPFGVIPFVYINQSAFNLIPGVDYSNKSMAILIPKLLADLNYAVQFCSHSITVGIDVEIDNLDRNPDAMWLVNSVDKEGASPSLSTISPTVDTDKVLGLISSTIGMWLDSKGIKTSAMGSTSIQSAASGIAKLIDESDATAIVKRNMGLFRRAEQDLWSILKVMHNVWINSGQLAVGLDFSSDFRPNIEFAPQQVIVDEGQTLKNVELMFKLGLTNRKMALQKLNPNLNSNEVDAMIQDIDSADVVEDSEDVVNG